MAQPDAVIGNEQRISPWKAVFTVLVSPKKTFEALGDHPPVLPGYLASMASSIFLIIAVLKLVPDTQAARGFGGAPASAITLSVTLTVGFMLASPWIAGAVNSQIAVYVGQMLGGNVRYSQYFGIIGYARLPIFLWSALDSLLALISVKIPQTLAFLVPKGSSVYLWAFVDSLKPFDLWYFCLLAVGFATLHKKRPAKGALLPLAIYLLSLAFDFYKVSTRGVPGW